MGAIFTEGRVASVRFAGDGETREFPFEFAVFAPDDVTVYVNGAVMSENIDIALDKTREHSSGDAGQAIKAATGGKVTFAIAPDDGADIVISRRLGLRRLSHYDSGSSLRADVLNADFDYVLAALGDVEAGFASTLRLPEGGLNGAGEVVLAQLPQPRANHAIMWDATARQLVNGPDSAAINGAAAASATAQNAATRADSAAELARQSLAGFVNQSATALLQLDCRGRQALAYQDERRTPMIDAPGNRMLDVGQSGAVVRVSNGGQITLPACAPARNGVTFRIFNGDGTATDIAAATGDVLHPIDGGNDVGVLALPLRGDAVDVFCDGTRWQVLVVRSGGPLVKMLRTQKQAIPAGGEFVVEWDSIIEDSHGLYDAGTDGIHDVPPGFYHFDIGICMELADQSVQGMLFVERLGAGGWNMHLQGVDTLPNGADGRKILRCSGIARAGIGTDNAFRVRVAHGATDTRHIVATSLASWFHAVRLSA
ncbi:hypothetical protein TH25_20105 [Thalassospira profundimaris]|uniref:Uncharacterized protein n=1 Tax=Thalassospira profundimaris TaxID=502049 RepID=A0A367WSM0_9PROT|nr:hypothetical protein [Thalassospira profundimaris]RCK44209.1 hypothetical protein TH25_20105 [Thalassospira profundimaris]